MSEPLKQAMSVLDDYLGALNHGDERGVNDACNFPHVILSGGGVVVWPNHGDYRLDDFRSRAGDGWHHSTWDERTPIHIGASKVHLKVRFSRWRKDGSLIGTFETLYIVARQDGHWGIQARSSFAS